MMKQMLTSLLTPYIIAMAENEINNEERKKKIQKEFNETVNLPRKKKKRRRKELQIDWQFANWQSEPQYDFGNMFKTLYGI
jgi:hypothetical protein